MKLQYDLNATQMSQMRLSTTLSLSSGYTVHLAIASKIDIFYVQLFHIFIGSVTSSYYVDTHAVIQCLSSLYTSSNLKLITDNGLLQNDDNYKEILSGKASFT